MKKRKCVDMDLQTGVVVVKSKKKKRSLILDSVASPNNEINENQATKKKRKKDKKSDDLISANENIDVTTEEIVVKTKKGKKRKKGVKIPGNEEDLGACNNVEAVDEMVSILEKTLEDEQQIKKSKKSKKKQKHVDVDSEVFLETEIIKDEVEVQKRKVKKKKQTLEPNVALIETHTIETAENLNVIKISSENNGCVEKKRKKKSPNKVKKKQKENPDPNTDKKQQSSKPKKQNGEESGKESTNKMTKKTEKKSNSESNLENEKLNADGRQVVAAPDKKPNVGQWVSSDLGDVNRQDKFFRLLGGMKKQNSNLSTNKFSSLAKNFSQSKQLNDALENQFNHTMAFNLQKRNENNKSKGLGFVEDPAKGKKFDIDIKKSNSIKFDD